MRRDSSSDVADSEAEDERSITAVADEPGVTRERAPEIAPGDVLAGRYQIEAVIGKGGSGLVGRAVDRASATGVAGGNPSNPPRRPPRGGETTSTAAPPWPAPPPTHPL